MTTRCKFVYSLTLSYNFGDCIDVLKSQSGVHMGDYHKCLFATDLIFYNILKSNRKIPLHFVEEALAMLTSGLLYRLVISPGIER